MKQALKLFNTRQAFFLLFLLNVVVGLVIFRTASNTVFVDSFSYMKMGESIVHGTYSEWYDYAPKFYYETLRTPGYPLFLAIFIKLGLSQIVIKLVQLVLYFSSVYMVTLIIAKYKTEYQYRNLFLMLLLVNVQVVYYTGFISAEIVDIFFIVITMYFTLLQPTYQNAFLIALFSYFAFLVRPIFLFVPFIIFSFFIITNRAEYRKYVLMIVSYVLLLMPFAIWNKVHHNVFKVTSLEGGAGVAHMGFWQYKLPDGYTEPFYWHNNTMYDLTKPKFFTQAEAEKNKEEFEAEWVKVKKDLAVYQSGEDSISEEYMEKHCGNLFIIHNTAYTLAREKMLWKLSIDHIKAEPLYYFNSRLYSFLRFYVTGVNYRNLHNAKSIAGKIGAIAPMVVTLLFIFIGMFVVAFAILSKTTTFKNGLLFVLLMFYYGGINIPFVTQSRYTIPVHIFILAFLAMAIIDIAKRYFKKSDEIVN